MVKVAVTGPESSGKTTLSNQLITHFGGVLVKEYSRIYLENKTSYEKEDVRKIAEGQFLNYQKALTEEKSLLISDTEMTVLKIWFEEKYGESDPEINKLLASQDFDMYLLMKPDIPWEKDPLREHPNQRDYLFEKYERLLTKLNLPFKIIQGSFDNRFNNAKNLVNGLLGRSL